MGGKMQKVVFAAMLVLAAALSSVHGLIFEFHSNKRCFEEDIHKGVLVAGEYGSFIPRPDIVDFIEFLNVTEPDYRGHFVGLDTHQILEKIDRDHDTNAKIHADHFDILEFHEMMRNKLQNVMADDDEANQEYQEFQKRPEIRSMYRKSPLQHRKDYEQTKIWFINKVTVTDPEGKLVYEEIDSKKRSFSFESAKAGMYKACFEVFDEHNDWPFDLKPSKLIPMLSKHETPARIFMHWRVGSMMLDFDQIEKGMEFEGFANFIQRINKFSIDVKATMDEIAEKEQGMMERAFRAEKRFELMYFIALIMVIVISVLQAVYLRFFLKKRKVV